MRETIEFRIAEERARKFLEPELGVLLGDSLRKVVLPVNDKRVQRIKQVEQEYRSNGGVFFTYWAFHRYYSEEELQSAVLLELKIRAYFEPPGALCSTEYDESVACRHCGAGAQQVSDLMLNTRRIPKGKDIAQTIAGEIVLSPRLVQVLREKRIRGAEYRPVFHQGRKGPEPTEWKQLVVTSKPVKLSTRTAAGIHPFDLDEKGEYRCPKEHMAGLNQLSELYVERSSVEKGDWFRTDKLFGVKRGVLCPEPRVLISQKLRGLLVELKAKGFALEVAHLV